MSTTIKPEVSRAKKYWIEKHRYYELKHFCLQYPIWKEAYFSLNTINNSQLEIAGVRTKTVADPVAKCA